MPPTINKPIIVAGDGNYEPGDIVTIVSGGPDMTVLGVCADCGEVEVAWFNVNEEDGFIFHKRILPRNLPGVGDMKFIKSLLERIWEWLRDAVSNTWFYLKAKFA